MNVWIVVQMVGEYDMDHFDIEYPKPVLKSIACFYNKEAAIEYCNNLACETQEWYSTVYNTVECEIK
jgi:hypothetical protein